MITSNYLSLWEGLGEFSLGLYKEVAPRDRDVKERKTKKAGTDAIVLTAICSTIEQFEKYRRKNVITSLADVLTGNAHYSIATSQLFEIIVPAFCDKKIISKADSFLYLVYKELEEMQPSTMGHFFKNAAFIVRNYSLTDHAWLKNWISTMADLSIQHKKAGNLFSRILLAIATDTEYDEIFSKTLKTIAAKDEYLTIYWNAVKVILKNDNDKVLTAISFIFDEDRYLSIKPLLGVKNIELDGQKVINVLTWDYNRQTGYFLKSKSEVELFCILTSDKPRQQLLHAWQNFKTDKEINRKGLYLLSQRAEEKLPRKEGDDVSVRVTAENFHERFPLLETN